MATDALIGIGATLKIANASAVLTSVGEVIEISLPNPQTEDVEATHFASPNRQREWVAGLIDNGEISFSINWVPGNATDDIITEAQASGDARGVEIIIPSGTATSETFTFDALIKGFEKNIPIDDRMTATVTMRVSGAVTQAATI